MFSLFDYSVTGRTRSSDFVPSFPAQKTQSYPQMLLTRRRSAFEKMIDQVDHVGESGIVITVHIPDH